MLIDTHSLLWFSLDDARLSDHAKSVMMDRGNELIVSPATFWEIAIKISIGKYELREEFLPFFSKLMAENEMSLLPVSLKHAAVIAGLPFHHRDPFDRLLIAQAISEEVPIVSADCELDPYSVTRIW